MAAPRPTISCPTSWWTRPFHTSLKKLIRPATANRRRKELTIKMQMPREVFEEIVAPLTTDDVAGLERDESGHLVPTRTTAAVNYYEYSIRKGSVSDRLFHLDALDPPPKPSRKRKAEEMAIGEEEDIYEVQEIREKRFNQEKKRTEYLVKWHDWPETTNTWEPARNINKEDVAAFEGRPLKYSRADRPSMPARGVGCARARLSSAAEARGGKPETISMICGNVLAKLKEPKNKEVMPTATVTFFEMGVEVASCFAGGDRQLAEVLWHADGHSLPPPGPDGLARVAAFLERAFPSGGGMG